MLNNFYRILLFLGVTLLAVCSPDRLRAQEVHDILVLHSFHAGLAWSENVNKGIAEVLLAKDRQDVELHVEYLDGLRRQGDAYFKQLCDFYRDKYKDIHFDAVIGVDNIAFNFLRTYHPHLFEDTPILFCGINGLDQDEVLGERRFFAGIKEEFDLNATIKAGLHIYPDTKRIVVINDRSLDGRIYAELIRESIGSLRERLDFEILDDLTMDELLDKVRDLQKGTLVVLVNFTRDREGRTYSHVRSLGLIAARCKVPILSMWHFYLGYGVLGGEMIKGEDQGMAVGKMVIDILMKEPNVNLFARQSTPEELIFDYNLMKRYDIPYKALPRGSIVTKEPQSILWKYKKIGWTVLGIALALEATVIILSVVTYRSKKAEHELEELVNKRTIELITANDQLKEENATRKKVEAALRKSEETLHQLSVNLLTVQENERRRISVELHDELGQSLAALKMQVIAFEKQLSRVGGESFAAESGELRESINLIIENVRRLSRDLSPVALEDLGIDAALEYLITTFAKLHEIQVTMDLIEITHLFSQGAQRHIYRIIQESLNNIGKHANADHVLIRIEKLKNRVFILVQDNGNGFNTSLIQSEKTPESGMGLAAMAERVRILEGFLDIESEPGTGTTVKVSLPV